MTNIKIIQRTKELKDGTFPIVLRITKDRKYKIISTGLSCEKKDWDAIKSVFRKSYKLSVQGNNSLNKLKEKALSIKNEFTHLDSDYSLGEYVEKFRGKPKNNLTISEFWLDTINTLNENGRTGNARSHKNTYNSFFKFQTSKKIQFIELNYSLLEKYEAFLRKNLNQDGGIGVKMRTLRALYNDAINKGVVQDKYYPFKKFKVSKFKSKNVKKALSWEEVGLIENFNVSDNPQLLNTHNYAVFSYHLGGINFVDLLKLEWKNVKNNRIDYTRSKTKKKFSVKITEPVKKILDYYQSHNNGTKYIFPILLNENLTPIQIENRKLRSLKLYNKNLKTIAEKVGITAKVTSYTIRHSFATNLKQKGIPIEKISEIMGHKNVMITNAYLKEFDKEILDIAMTSLLREDEGEYTTLMRA